VDRRVLAIIVSAVVLAVIVVVVVVARGGDDSSSGGDLSDTSQKPNVEVPSDPPPDQLKIEDIVDGDGAEAQKGDQVSVQYVGVDYETGEEFDSSWDRDQPVDFQLGSGMVIPGWDQGVEGMKVGGRRELTVPPDLAYGPQGSPPAIRPNATLVFVIDLLSVK
jgi:peptidylprolyl isomerase